ncbi:MAG: hypothetical protein R3F11_12220 [Verrucomicrobiales bacterium]
MCHKAAFDQEPLQLPLARETHSWAILEAVWRFRQAPGSLNRRAA